jgi:ABC-type sugar transport system permease subunit
VLLTIALVVGSVAKRRTGRAVELGNPTMAPLLAGLLFLAFAAFTAVRGTIANNLWWVVTVVFASTAMGLAVAVLADRAKNEKLAKSLIFMPLAVSLVGASVIWRFMYQPRDASVEQTGVLNALWVGLGRLSTGSGIPTFVVGIITALVLLGLLVVVVRALVRRQWARVVLPVIGIVLVGWFFVRYIGSGIGGFVVNANGQTVPNPVAFVQEQPFNNVWLMVILIWLQTGFAMVIFSAAIKAVPDEIIEAAQVDGATPSQIFWRVTLPQIATTIGVVVTTLVVTVMKVFDIVKVVTNGNFDTQVLANDFFQKSFSDQNRGRGAALAILILVSVVPVIIYNVRRMQKET